MIIKIKSKYPWDMLAKFTEKGFLRLLRKEIKTCDKQLDAKKIVLSVMARSEEIFILNQPYISDEVSQFHILLTSYILSSVEMLTDIVGEEQAKSITSAAFKANGRLSISLSIKIGLFFSREKFSYIVKNCGEGVVAGYGDSFSIKLDTDRTSYLNTQVSKCGFHEFFIRNARPELTKLMCDWDDNWSDTLKDNKHIGFNRPTTIASGGKICDFRFYKKT